MKSILYPQGHILQEIVDQTGLSINDFANKINTLPSTVSRNLNTIKLSSDFIQKVIDAFDVPSDYFFRTISDNGNNINQVSQVNENGNNHAVFNHTESDWKVIEEQLKSSRQRVVDLESQINALQKYIALLEGDAKK